MEGGAPLDDRADLHGPLLTIAAAAGSTRPPTEGSGAAADSARSGRGVVEPRVLVPPPLLQTGVASAWARPTTTGVGDSARALHAGGDDGSNRRADDQAATEEPSWSVAKRHATITLMQQQLGRKAAVAAAVAVAAARPAGRRQQRSRSRGGEASTNSSSPLRGADGARALLEQGPSRGLPPAPSERWQDGRHGAMTVMAQALQKWPRSLEAAWPRGGAWLELSLPSLLERALEVADREWRVGGRAYIGSTSDPAWRWRGGWYRSAGVGRGRPDGWAFLAGHHEEWRHMIVVGSWPDAWCGRVETKILQAKILDSRAKLVKVCPHLADATNSINPLSSFGKLNTLSKKLLGFSQTR